MTASQIYECKGQSRVQPGKQDGAMESQSYQILFIGEDLSRMQAYVQMLQAEDVFFDVTS